MQPKIISAQHQMTRMPPNIMLQQQQQQEPVAETKLYHCTYCQQLFFKLKSFKKHQCVPIEASHAYHQHQLQNSQKQQQQQQHQVTKRNSENVYTLENPLLHQTTVETSIKSPNTVYQQRSMSSSSSNSSNSQIQANVKSHLSPPHLTPQNPPTSPPGFTSNEPKPSKTTSITESFAHENILKHPLVVKTLLETYKVSSIDELDMINLNSPSSAKLSEACMVNKYFYMCSTCGYRGNTVRGVKQHGKQLHLINKEHFGIINATETQPLLVYYSQNDSDLHLNGGGSSKRAMPSSLTVLPHKILKTGNVQANAAYLPPKSEDSHTEDESTDSDEEEASQSFVVLKNLTAISKVKEEFVAQQQPVSKKARLLEAHQRIQEAAASQESASAKLANSNVDISAPVSVKIVDKSQTYCVKCNIQFQQVSNFLAHKTNYCKDN